MPGLRELGLGIHYEGTSGTILSQLVLPALDAASEYDRLTGYFSVASLLAISEGIDELWRRGGRMRLVIGLHDVPEDLITAASGVDWVDRLITSVRERLLADVARLPDEFARSRIGTLAWMMRDGLLAVRVAAPVGPHAILTSQSIFHSKRLIFRDPAGDVVSAVGSPNETVAGLSENFEDLTVHMSWNDALGYVRTHEESFERIWTGSRPELAIRVLDESFSQDLARAAGTQWARPSPAVEATPYRELLTACRDFPTLSTVNLSNAALFPHQERALIDAADRWPIRVLLADEVGLGKTLEAGALIALLLRSHTVRRVVILAPKNVVRQWRDEMASHFRLDFWVYESAGRYFESSEKRVRRLPTGNSPVGSAAPDLLIMSAQLARGSGSSGDVFASADTLPDLLVVDEAHAARVRLERDGSRRPTRLWRMLDRLADQVPHLVLLTATPLQLNWGEYYSLLELLGLPAAWKLPEYERSLRILAGRGKPSLNDVNAAVGLLDASRLAYGLGPEDAGPQPGDHAAAGRAIAVSARWDEFYPTFVRLHPASLLTVRNSREALERLGYKFPERVFDAPALDIHHRVLDFYEGVGTYLRDAYGTVEAAAAPGRVNLGFAKSTYFQRLASTLAAARLTLERRRARLAAILDRRDPGEPEEDEGLDEDEDADLVAFLGRPLLDEATRKRIDHAGAIEMMFVDDLLRQLNGIAAKGIADPKLAMLLGLLVEIVPEDKVLVFSRYTDSVDACVNASRESMGDALVGHGVYTGRGAWIDIGSGPTPVSKEGVRQALEDGLIRVLFCSDAASEGLNLQAARVIINVDVPWNPARLEQRIGRIARLGQRATAVRIANLWYPDSVEARMYGRLLARRDLYQLAVGSVPQLFDDGIRAEVANRLGADEAGEDPIDELQRVREDLQIQAIARVWERDLVGTPKSKVQRERLAAVVRAAADPTPAPDGLSERVRFGDGRQYDFTVEPGMRNSLTLLHPVLDRLRPRPANWPTRQPLYIMETESGRPVGACIGRGEAYGFVSPEDVPDLLAACLDLAPFSPSGLFDWLPREQVLESATRAVAESSPAPPGVGRMSLPRPPDEVNSPRPVSPRADHLRVIGLVPVAGLADGT